MNVQIEESWKARLEPEFEKDYFPLIPQHYYKIFFLST